MLSVVKMPLKGEVGGCALNSHEKLHCWSWKIMEKSLNCVFKFLWEPCPLPFYDVKNTYHVNSHCRLHEKKQLQEDGFS